MDLTPWLNALAKTGSVIWTIVAIPLNLIWALISPLVTLVLIACSPFIYMISYFWSWVQAVMHFFVSLEVRLNMS